MTASWVLLCLLQPAKRHGVPQQFLNDPRNVVLTWFFVVQFRTYIPI